MAAPAATTTTNGDNGTDKLVNCKYINKMEARRGEHEVKQDNGESRTNSELWMFGSIWRNWGYTQGDGDKDR